MGAKLIDDLALRLPVEVDQHVPAKDQIKYAEMGEVVEQIDLPKLHHRADIRRNLPGLAGAPAADRCLVMGVVNVTPDSFSDGGRWFGATAAIEHGLELVAQGADIVDVGGESTRPGADPVSAEEEIERVLPVLEGLRGKLRIPISLDTQKAVVAEAGIAAGVEIINDVSGLRLEPPGPNMIHTARPESRVVAADFWFVAVRFIVCASMPRLRSSIPSDHT